MLLKVDQPFMKTLRHIKCSFWEVAMKKKQGFTDRMRVFKKSLKTLKIKSALESKAHKQSIIKWAKVMKQDYGRSPYHFREMTDNAAN